MCRIFSLTPMQSSRVGYYSKVGKGPPILAESRGIRELSGFTARCPESHKGYVLRQKSEPNQIGPRGVSKVCFKCYVLHRAEADQPKAQ
jgi:hypothetical protein